jgi:hypothetical protein
MINVLPNLVLLIALQGVAGLFKSVQHPLPPAFRVFQDILHNSPGGKFLKIAYNVRQ